MSEVRFATIGTSMITGLFCEAVAAVDGARIAGVYSRGLDKAFAYAQKVGAEFAFDSLDGVATCQDIDAVYIASPNLFHMSQALQMIAAGKAVLVEKPLGTNLTEEKRVFAAAEEAGVVAMEAMRLAHDPGYTVVRETLERLGAIRRASFRYGKYSSRYDLVLAGEHTNIFDPKLATGALMDLGIYPLSAMVSLFGTPDDLACFGVTIDVSGQDDLIDVAGSALLDYDGMICEIAYNKVGTDTLGCQIEGEKATLSWQDVGLPRHLLLTGIDGSQETIEVEERPGQGSELNLIYEVEDFVAAMNGAYDPTPQNQNSVVVSGIMEAIRFREGIVFPSDAQEIAG